MPLECDHVILTVKIYGLFGLRPSRRGWFEGISSGSAATTVTGSSGEGRVWIHSNRELSPEERGRLDALMADPGSGLPPKRGDETVFVIRDVFDAWEAIERAAGAKVRWVFPNVPDHTSIEVWMDRRLSSTEKGKVLGEYRRLISEKP